MRSRDRYSATSPLYFPERASSACKNKANDLSCKHWAGLGLCQDRPQYMIENCQDACNACPKGASSLLACLQALPRLSASFLGNAARAEKLGRVIKGRGGRGARLFLTRSSSSRALLFKPSGEPVGGLLYYVKTVLWQCLAICPQTDIHILFSGNFSSRPRETER